MEALFHTRGELSSQLQSLMRMRKEVLEQARMAGDASRSELLARVRVFDQRAVRLEQQLLQIDEVVAQGIARGVAQQAPPADQVTVTHVEPPLLGPHPFGGPFGGPSVERALLVQGLVFVLLGAVLMRWLWKRAERKFSRALPDQGTKIDQLQQAVDVIAVEVERISEGQRFVSKMLNERQPEGAAPAASARLPEAARVEQKR